MIISQIAERLNLKIINKGSCFEKEAVKIFCCDMLSLAMSKAPSDCIWITVMANINTLAVASLADVNCVILAEGTAFDEDTLAKASEQDITVLATDAPVFETALGIHTLLNPRS